MEKKSIIGITSIIIIGFSLIITIPIVFLSIALSPYGIIDDLLSFEYVPGSSSSIEKLNLNVDYGKIEIGYIFSPVDYYAKIDLKIEMIGVNLAGKSSTEFFNITWQDTSPTPSFTLQFKSSINKEETISLIKNINVFVTLRADITFDIITTLNEGYFELFVPWGVSIGNAQTNVSIGNILYDFEYCTIRGNITGTINNGDIFYDFNHCTIEGNITGIVNIGNIELTTLNAQYTRYCIWNFTIDNGKFDVFIYQYEDLGTNITGKVHIRDGNVFVFYNDNSDNSGARFEIPFGNGFMNHNGFPQCVHETQENITCTLVYGFEHNRIASDEGIIYFVSDDLLANIVLFYYSITFDIIQGSFDMELTSTN
ncbi:MAG: hypothetical protein ACFE91_06080 [Promethearchaeota archaeon]